jgi:hypothetical protein
MGAGKIDLDEMEKALRCAAKQVSRTARAKEQRQPFTKFPDSWADRLRSARGVTYRAALFILRQHWKTSGQPVRLSNTALAAEGVGRNSKWRALRELEEARLIRVEKRPRRSPVAIIIVE